MKSHMLYTLISLRWVWIIFGIALIILSKNLITILEDWVNLKIEQAQSADYSEDKIIAHLDYIIHEALDEYVIFNINPRNLYYINSEMETKIIDDLTNKVPERISETLMANLSKVYSYGYIGELIGRRIYMLVLNYVLDFNLKNNPDAIAQNKKNQNNLQ